MLSEIKKQPAWTQLQVDVMTGRHDGAIRTGLKWSTLDLDDDEVISQLREWVTDHIEPFDEERSKLVTWIAKLAKYGHRRVLCDQTPSRVPYHKTDAPIDRSIVERSMTFAFGRHALVSDKVLAHRWRHAILESPHMPQQSSPEDRAYDTEIAKAVHQAMMELDDNELFVVENRLDYLIAETSGDVEHPPTLELIAEYMGVSRERARQVQVKALARLRKKLLHVWREYQVA